VMVAFIYQGDFRIRAIESARAFETREAAAYNEDSWLICVVRHKARILGQMVAV
jgi:hypothetical protein